jgi:hypothetical protein
MIPAEIGDFHVASKGLPWKIHHRIGARLAGD